MRSTSDGKGKSDGGKGRSRTGVPKDERLSPKRFAIEFRRTRATDLYLRGLTQTEIAETLKAEGIPASQKTISRDLVALQQEWAKKNLHGIDEWKREQLAKCDAIEREAWAGWEASKTKNVSDVAKRLLSAAEITTHARQRTETGAGDPSFLEIVDRMVDRRCKILGLYAPKVHKGDDALRRLSSLLALSPDEFPD